MGALGRLAAPRAGVGPAGGGQARGWGPRIRPVRAVGAEGCASTPRLHEDCPAQHAHARRGAIKAKRLCRPPHTERLQDGHARLPDVNITDKNDTFHVGGDSFSTFRLMARAVRRDLYSRPVPLEGIPPAVSGKFVVSPWGQAHACSSRAGHADIPPAV